MPLNELYPKPKSFSDPDGIGRNFYASIGDYISRWVSLYEDTNQSSLMRLMAQEKRLSLRGAVQKHKKILMLCDAGMGKSIELQNLAHELSGRFHTFLYLLENYSGQDIQELLPESYRQLPPNRIALLLDGYDELDSELAKTFRNKIKQYTQDAPAVNIVISSHSIKRSIPTSTMQIRFETEPHRISDLVCADPTIIEYLKDAYQDGSLKSHRAFYEIVLWYVRDELKYVEYAKLIKEIDGVGIQEYTTPIDYDALKRKAAQEYFEILFDEEKRNALTDQLLNAIDNPDVTTTQLLEVDIQADHYSAIRRLQTAMYHSGYNVKISEFFGRIDMDRFVIWSASRFLSEKSTVVPTPKEKERLTEITANILKDWNFENSVIYYPDGFRLYFKRLPSFQTIHKATTLKAAIYYKEENSCI